jgi:RNA polymerase sigma factor (sigma-70 family)
VLLRTPILLSQSDERLVALVREGSEPAFETIVRRYRRPLLRHCSRVLPAGRAEDAVQQTFLKAYQALTNGDTEINLRPWLYRIAHNTSLNALRENGWTHDQLDESIDGVERPDQAFERRESLRETVAAVRGLPGRQRDALVLRELEGMSHEQIAGRLGVTPGAVRQLLHRARTGLRAAASALTPSELVLRLAGGEAGKPIGARIAELCAGAGAGAVAAKACTAALVTGALVAGAGHQQLNRHERSDPAPQREAQQGERASLASAAHTAPAAQASSGPEGGNGEQRAARDTDPPRKPRAGTPPRQPGAPAPVSSPAPGPRTERDEDPRHDGSKTGGVDREDADDADDEDADETAKDGEAKPEDEPKEDGAEEPEEDGADEPRSEPASEEPEPEPEPAEPDKADLTPEDKSEKDPTDF